ncbi:MAG: hypothetical protein IMZ43_02870 [Thermoplasmata archaeon]|nr:hypothetical protein [Thermoplasmata archaeon]
MHLSVAPLRSDAEIVDKEVRLFGLGLPGFRGTLGKHTEDMVVDGHRIQDEIGFRPKYYFISGWKVIIEEMYVRGDF